MVTNSLATRARIEDQLRRDLAASHVSVEDESWKHAGHAGARMGGGHFVVEIVSDRFGGLSALDRRRLVFEVLKAEMQGAIHALTVRAFSPDEWSG